MSSYNKWIPFELACRLRVLNQGSLVKGNTQLTIASLKADAITEANGSAVWARWNPTLTYKLQIKPASVPGFVKPVAS